MECCVRLTGNWQYLSATQALNNQWSKKRSNHLMPKLQLQYSEKLQKYQVPQWKIMAAYYTTPNYNGKGNVKLTDEGCLQAVLFLQVDTTQLCSSVCLLTDYPLIACFF